MTQKTTFIRNLSYNRLFIISLLILAAATIVILPIWIQGFPRGSDIGFHYRWNTYFAEELRQGHLYPRWLSQANRGYGSPVPLYYPPLQFYVTAAINFFVHDTLRAITLACLLATALCGLTMYQFSRAFLSRRYSLAAAVLYMWGSYHLLDLYRGNSLSQYWSYVWIPLVLNAIHRIVACPGWRDVPYLAISYALLCLTHLPLVFATTLMTPVYLLLLTRKPRHFLRIGAGLALGIGLSGFFLASVLLERQYVTLNEALRLIYYNCFLFEHLGQLRSINLFTNADYAGLEGFLLEIDLVAVGIVLLWALSSFILWRARNNTKQKTKLNPLLVAVWVLTTLSLFLTIRVSTFIWRIIPQLEFMQCPDRWLVIVTAGTCLLVVAAIASVIRSGKRSMLIGTLLTVAVILNLLISAHITRQRPLNPEQLWNRLQQLKEAPQYTPVWWNHEWQDEFEQTAIVISSGDATINAINDSGVQQSYTVTSRTDSILKFRSLYFPGWTARLNGESVAISPSEDGHIQLAIPPGDYTLTLSFEDTWQRTAGKMVSAFSLLIWIALIFVTRRKRQAESEPGAVATG